MVRKKIVLSLVIALLIPFLCTGCFNKKEATPSSTEKNVTEQNNIKPAVAINKEIQNKFDLYSETPYDLPLFSITEIAKLPQQMKDSVDKILDLAQGFYLLRYDGEKVLIILQTPIKMADVYNRHDLQFAEISSNGAITYHLAGYSGLDGEILDSTKSKNDIWLFDEASEPLKPIKHTHYDEKGKIKYTEFWSYDEDTEVKYQMKDSKKQTISILKESQKDELNYRKEHIFYDNEGNTKMSLSINYEGANISRITFYNSHDSIDSMTIISEYEDGHKVKELIYNEDYKLINTVKAEYIDGVRNKIILLDNNENIVTTLNS